jgi:hypothetical protein
VSDMMDGSIKDYTAVLIYSPSYSCSIWAIIHIFNR